MMKRSTVFLAFLGGLFLLLAGFAWSYRDGLARAPGDGSFNLIAPLSALPMPDGGFALVDSHSERIVRFDAAGQTRWEIRPRTLFGRFLAVDAGPDGMLYCIDELARPGVSASGSLELAQRLLRIGLDGSLAAVLLERRVIAGTGFIPGSLRVQDGELWYLYDEGPVVVLASLDIATLTERSFTRSDWALDRASLATGGPGGIVALAAEGGLALFQRDRFETLSEYAFSLPFPACIRYDGLGRLYIADPVAGLMVRIAPDQEPQLIIAASAGIAGPGSILVRDVAFDNFAISPEGLVLVDRRNASVLVVDPDAVSDTGQARMIRELASFSVPDHELGRSWLGWGFLAGSLVAGLALLFLLAYNLAVHAPKPAAMLGAALPGLLCLAFVLALAWYGGDLGRHARAEAASLERLRAAAVAGAGALSGLELYGRGTLPGTSPGILADAVSPESAVAVITAIHPKGSAGWISLRHRLASMVDNALYSDWPPVSAVLYLETAGSFRYICDSDGLQVPGMVQSMVPGSFELAVSLGRPMVEATDNEGQSWLSAVAPLETPAGGPSILLEMTSPGSMPSRSWLQRLLACYVPEPEPGALLALFVMALSVFMALPVLVSRRREVVESRDWRIGWSSMDAKRQAVSALKAGRADEARFILERVVDQDPLDAQALNNLGAAYVRLGKFDEAQHCFEAVVQTQPGHGAAKANLARLKDRLAKRRPESKENRW